LEFLEAHRGVFSYNFPGIYNRGAIEITPVAPLISDPLNYIWYDKTYTGSGFTFQAFPPMQSDEGIIEPIAAAWYAQDKGNDIWFSCQGKKVGDLYEMTIYLVDGGRWCYFSEEPEGVNMIDCGKVVLDPATMVLTYDIKAPGIVDTGTRKLERAF